ncbi:TIGR03084 family metal-binding protein [Streptomyces filamentosus]|uniref:TIGR03084 family metal-binding protein n=1 Tax=Streptomyces filamentosus TaxID=67294 RepID=UPI001238D82E|nr:TIGR03084 family metal-binding protein [Streptomyces filamentosus]KAA6218965.1 TIGR03084 family protein [Streptomyces filamentosus]
MSDPADVLVDLRAEGGELDAIVSELSEEQWRRATPAPGWSVAHQIAHLAWTDRAALLAITDGDGFAAEVEKALAAPERFVDGGAEEGAALPPGELLARWREGRERLEEALRGVPAGGRFPWYGPPMSAPAMATARLMETWAHGQDVADALGVVRKPTARLRHVAWIGHRARDYAYLVRGEQPPGEPVRVELVSPEGELWAYGPEDAAQRVTGDALEFCLLVTQRVHRDDTALRAEGAGAEHWLRIAQAFAGPVGAGRPAGAGGSAGTGGGA